MKFKVGKTRGSEGRTLGDDMNQYYIQWMKREISDEDVVARVGQDMYQVFRMQREFELEGRMDASSSQDGSQKALI